MQQARNITSKALHRRPSRSQSGMLAAAAGGFLSARSLPSLDVFAAFCFAECGLKCRTGSNMVTPETALWATSTFESKYLIDSEGNKR
jgi:hypothetical protein